MKLTQAGLKRIIREETKNLRKEGFMDWFSGANEEEAHHAEEVADFKLYSDKFDLAKNPRERREALKTATWHLSTMTGEIPRWASDRLEAMISRSNKPPGTDADSNRPEDERGESPSRPRPTEDDYEPEFKTQKLSKGASKGDPGQARGYTIDDRFDENKLTKGALKQIIKEEIDTVMKEDFTWDDIKYSAKKAGKSISKALGMQSGADKAAEQEKQNFSDAAQKLASLVNCMKDPNNRKYLFQFNADGIKKRVMQLLEPTYSTGQGGDDIAFDGSDDEMARMSDRFENEYEQMSRKMPRAMKCEEYHGGGIV